MKIAFATGPTQFYQTVVSIIRGDHNDVLGTYVDAGNEDVSASCNP